MALSLFVDLGPGGDGVLLAHGTRVKGRVESGLGLGLSLGLGLGLRLGLGLGLRLGLGPNYARSPALPHSWLLPRPFIRVRVVWTRVMVTYSRVRLQMGAAKYGSIWQSSCSRLSLHG